MEGISNTRMKNQDKIVKYFELCLWLKKKKAQHVEPKIKNKQQTSDIVRVTSESIFWSFW